MQTHVNVGCMMHLSFHAAVYHHLKSRTYTAAVIRPRCLYRQTFLTISDLRSFPFNKNSGLKFLKFYVPNGTVHSGWARWFEQLFSVSKRILAARSRELWGREFATRAILSLKDFEQTRDCSKSNRSWKRDIKERYWGQELCQMERDISVRLSDMIRPVKVDHHQSWSRIFRSDQTEICPFHLI